MLRGLLLLVLGGATHSLKGWAHLWSLFHYFGDLGSRFLLGVQGRGLSQLLVGSCHGLDSEKVWAEASSRVTTGLAFLPAH